MYIDVVEGRRTQITLTTAQHSFLKDMSAWSGLPIAELIRRAVDQTYRDKSRLQKRGLHASVEWHRRSEVEAARLGRLAVPPKPRLHDRFERYD
jgi:hypothetical protein